MIERPGANGMKQSPDNKGHHDPGKDPFGTGRRWRCSGRHIEKDTPAGRRVTTALKTYPENKGPRNGPDPRGAGKLNRFRERLDGRFRKVCIGLEETTGIRAAA